MKDKLHTEEQAKRYREIKRAALKLRAESVAKKVERRRELEEKAHLKELGVE